MWDGLLLLLGLSSVMGIASFLAGLLPLSASLSRKQLRLISACGTGVLVGTALIVIIPEGIETLYSSQSNGNAHMLRTRYLTSSIEPSLPSTIQIRHNLESIALNEVHLFDRHLLPAGEKHIVHTTDDKNHFANIQRRDEETDAALEQKESSGQDDEHTHPFEPHAWVGVSLILGFILMYLIDQLPQLASSSNKPSYISLERLSFHGSSSASNRRGESDPDPPSTHSEPTSSSTTVGLVIHAAADGVALGASTTSSSRTLGFVVFLALMIHKAPAAFGLTAVLLKQGFSRRRARAHLIVFSLAAPVGALATWTAAQILGGGSLGAEHNSNFGTGLLLIFSGGTFLYVAMHTMQEGGHKHASTNGSLQNGYTDPYSQETPIEEEKGLLDTAVTVGGMLLPLLTQIGHAH